MAIEIMGVGVQGPAGYSFDVKRYGATGDGVTDDTEAFEDAIAAAAALDGIVFIPQGEYVLTTLTTTVSMRGHGDTSVLLISDYLYLGTDVTLEDVKVITSFDYGIFISTQDNIRIRNCTIESTAASISAGYTNGIHAYQSNNIQITGCKFNYAGIELNGGDYFLVADNYWDCEYLNISEPCHASRTSRGQFVNNTVYRSATDCLDLYSDGGYCIVTGNRFLSPRLTGSNGSVVEVKVTWSDDVDNTSVYPDEMQQNTIISNNLIKDAQIETGTGTRNGYSAYYLDSRAAPSWDQAETAPGMIISNNVFCDSQTTENVGMTWVGIRFTGHNSVISGNVIRNMVAWSSTEQRGIVLGEVDDGGVADGVVCIGVRVADNIIAGIDGNPGRGIYTGSLTDCTISGNIIRPDEHSTLTAVGKYGISIGSAAVLSGVTITGNLFHLPMSSSFAIHDGSTSTTLTDCVISNNRFKACGVQIRDFDRLLITGNNYENQTTTNGWTLGDSSTTSTGLTVVGNLFKTNNYNCLILNVVDRFIVTGNNFHTVARPVYAFNATVNGVVTNNISKTQGTGAAILLFDASVTAPNQATTYLSAAGDNKLVA